MAQTYRERQIEPRRAIELYEQILTENPDDDATMKALGELYEREGDDAGLAHTLRRQLDLDVQKLTTQMARSGKSVEGPKEWPVAKRSERLTTLRRLAILYETRLADVDADLLRRKPRHGKDDALPLRQPALRLADDQ
jgi:hypothetical protein